MTVTLYHNPACSKSRQTLQLLRDRDIEVDIVEYLNTPPSKETLVDLLGMLGKPASALVRRKEGTFTDLGLSDADDEALLDAMVANPVLIERPIVVSGRNARLGRPPENVLEIL
ncbi:MAG: arsenate reductase (glutaredoxin) [bacterium]|nr:arsenate reductase (glutaredoxin) [bacterium]MCP5071166.1 arsenate reductase (glutaredoxin) [bacterium]